MARLTGDELSKLAGGKDLLDISPQDIDKMAVGQGPFYLLDRRIDYLAALKDQVSAGKLPLLQYFEYADKIGKSANDLLNNLTTTGQKNATEANLRLSDLRQFVDLDSTSGNGNFKNSRVPFNRTEIAKLPQNVLPSADELNKANIPLDWFPPGTKLRTPDPVVSKPTTPTVPQINPGVNPSVPGAPVVTGPPPTTPITAVPDPANPGSSISVPIVGDPLKDTVSKSPDQVTIEQEAARQAEQSRQAYEAGNAIRSQRLTDLAGLLTQQENQKFSVDQPGIFEDLNTRGLLRSSGLGEALAKEKGNLAKDSANVLAQQGLSDRDAQIQGIQDILARSQQFQSSGLERRFTLEDFQREADTARTLGATVAPTVKPGNSVLSGVLGGVGTGAAAGGAIGGPWGAGIGAVLGGAGGGASAKGK